MLSEENKNDEIKACVGETELTPRRVVTSAIISPQWVEKMEAQSPDHTAVTSINSNTG